MLVRIFQSPARVKVTAKVYHALSSNSLVSVETSQPSSQLGRRSSQEVAQRFLSANADNYDDGSSNGSEKNDGNGSSPEKPTNVLRQPSPSNKQGESSTSTSMPTPSSSETIQTFFSSEPARRSHRNNTGNYFPKSKNHRHSQPQRQNDGNRKLFNRDDQRLVQNRPNNSWQNKKNDNNNNNMDGRSRYNHRQGGTGSDSVNAPRQQRQYPQNNSASDSKVDLQALLDRFRHSATRTASASSDRENQGNERTTNSKLFQSRIGKSENDGTRNIMSALRNLQETSSSSPPPVRNFPNVQSHNDTPKPFRLPENRQRQTQRTMPRQNYDRMPRNNGSKPLIRDDLEFLEGRMGRPAADTHEDSSQDADEPSGPSKTVTLPNASLDLTQTSTLFRIKVEDIRDTLETMGFAKDDIRDKDFKLDPDTLELVGMEHGISTIRGEEEVVMGSEEMLMKQRRVDDAVSFPPRPPVVCIMGHVDHGKTTLMDALRRRSAAEQNPKAKKSKSKMKKGSSEKSTDVAGTEAGGITQIISAFQVDVEGQDNKVTFLDTPGHAAFKSMRQSGSHAADVIVLVIAADDGVSEQTIEILNFYKSIVKGSNGGITLMVALNKIDKPGIEVEEARRRIENQLLEQGILCEGMGGDSEFGPPVQVIPTSGMTGEGLDDLIEGLVLQSEIMDLRADDNAHAEGIVMDARVEKGLGVVADCIIRRGSIEKGDYIVSGKQFSRVRVLKDVNDKVLKKGVPSQPVRLVGFKNLPKAGDPIVCVESEEVAEEMIDQRSSLETEDEVEISPGNLNDVEIHIGGMRKRGTRRVNKFHELAGLEEGDGTIRIPIVVKADADGSLSAVRDSLIGLGEKSTHKVRIDPIQEGIGEITPTDIQMAKESNACIFAFGLKRIDQAILNMAEAEGVEIRSNAIIYSLLDDAKETLGRYLPPTPVEQVHGRGSVQAIFVVDGEDGEERVAGMRVVEGNIYKAKDANNFDTHFRVFRNGELISPEGEVVTAFSLRRFKELVESVKYGNDCGLVLSGFDSFEQGDEIECYSIEMKKSTL